MAQKVLFKRKTSQQIEELPIEDGSLIYNVENGKTYMDYGNDRIQTGGNAETMIAITENEPTDEDIKLWIPTNVSNTKASEVVDSLDGNQTNYAPSIRAVNEALLDVYSTEEQKIGTWVDGKPLYRKTIYLEKLPSTTGTDIEYDCGFTNNVSVKKMYGYAYSSNLGFIFPLPFVGQHYISLNFHAKTNKLGVYVTIDRSNFTGHVTLEYTKTTD